MNDTSRETKPLVLNLTYRQWRQSFHDDQPLLQKPFSLIMLLVGFGFCILRRTNVWENLKYYFSRLSPWTGTPPIATEIFIIVVWIIAICFLLLSEIFQSVDWVKVTITRFSLWIIIQVLQTSLWHNFWRQVCLHDNDPRKTVVNHARNAIMAVMNLVLIDVLFAAVYRANSNWFDSCKFKNWLDALYFSVVTSSTVGYGDIAPLNSGCGKCTVAFHIAVSFLLVVVVISQSVSAIGKLKEKSQVSETTD